jgi:hypothetical protein
MSEVSVDGSTTKKIIYLETSFPDHPSALVDAVEEAGDELMATESVPKLAPRREFVSQQLADRARAGL